MPNRYLGTKSLCRALFDGGTFRRSPVLKSPLRESSKHRGFASAPRGLCAVLVDNRGSGDLGNRAPLRSSASRLLFPAALSPLTRHGSLSSTLHSAALAGHSQPFDGFEGSERCHQVGELYARSDGRGLVRGLDPRWEASPRKCSNALVPSVLTRTLLVRCRKVSRPSRSQGKGTWPPIWSNGTSSMG